MDFASVVHVRHRHLVLCERAGLVAGDAGGAAKRLHDLKVFDEDVDVLEGGGERAALV